MATILEVITRFLGDTKDVDAKIDTTEKKATTVGDRISGAVGKGAKLVAGAAAIGFGIATKGLLELESAQANFRSETGATAEEAEKAGLAINGMFRKNVQPMHEIGQALTDVTTKMGLTGDQAASTTQDFLTFARATKQDAVTAVDAFDNILDAWGLTAADAVGIMDKLVVSHARYGTSITGMQDGLARLAPQLRGLNLGLDDGIGLLNLFATKGLDASAAQRALNTAIQKLPPGTSLTDFITQLTAIEDPAERAAKASEVFGAMAGPKMANALVPGIKGLSDFEVTATDAAGATKRSAKVLDDEIGGRITRAVHDLTGALIGAGKEFGPVLTGLAGLGSLAGALGVDKLVTGLGKKLVSGLTAVGKQAGSALGDGLQSVWSGAGGTVIGNNIASRIENIMDPTKSTIIGNAWRGAASKAATVYLSALIFQDTVVAAIGARFGTTFGTASGTAAGIAFKLAFVAGVALIADAALPVVQKAGRDINRAIFGEGGGPLAGVGEWSRSLHWPFGPVGAPDWARIGAEVKEGGTTTGTAVLDGIMGAVGNVGGKVTTEIADGLASGKYVVVNGALVLATEAGAALDKGLTEGADRAKVNVQGVLTAILTAFQQFRSDLSKGAQAAADAMFDPAIKAAQLAETKLAIAEQTRIINDKKSTKDQVREATNRRLELQKTLFLQISDLTTYGTDAQKISAIKAALASKEVARAYRNGTPEQKAAIDLWRTTMNGKLTELQEQAKTGGAKATTDFASGEKSPAALGTVDRAADAVANAGKPDPPDTGPGSWFNSAVHAVGQWISGMLSQLGNVEKASGAVAARAHRNLAFSDPPPGPLHNIRQSGQHAAQEWFGGFTDELPRLGQGVAEQVRRFGLMNGTLGVEAQGGLHLYHHLLAEPGALPAGTTAAEIERLLNEGTDATGLLYQFRHAAGTR